MPAGFAPAVDASAAIAAPPAPAVPRSSAPPRFHKARAPRQAHGAGNDRQHRDDQEREPVRVTAS
jgi:hypothetical protein